MAELHRPLAVVTGASSGIGFELARQCAENGFDVVVVAEDDSIRGAAKRLAGGEAMIEPVVADLSTEAGVDQLIAHLDDGGRPVDALLANAGIGLGNAFLDQDWADARKVIDTNVIGTVYLLHRIGRQMRARHAGRILVTGSIAGRMPGSFQAVYNGTKSFLDGFAVALRDELADSGVTVTCLLPGATDTNFFARADMLDTPVGRQEKDDPAAVAKTGFKAMMRGSPTVVHGLRNKVQAAMARVFPDRVVARAHRNIAEPQEE